MAWFGSNKIGRLGRFLGNKPGLVGYWQLDGSSIDNSANGQNGSDTSVTYGPQSLPWMSGLRGVNVSHANGSNITITGTASIPTAAAPRTFGIWLQTTVSGTNQSVFGSGTSASGEQFTLYVVSGKDYFSGYSADIQGNIVLNDGKWHLFIVTYDGTTARLYVDGKYDTGSAESLNTVGTSIAIGRGLPVNTDGITGSLTEAFILNYQMSAAQIAQYYAWAIRKPQNWMNRLTNPIALYLRSASATMMNAASRYATAKRVLQTARSASVTMMNAASRYATASWHIFVLWQRTASVSMMNAASRYAKATKAFIIKISNVIRFGFFTWD